MNITPDFTDNNRLHVAFGFYVSLTLAILTTITFTIAFLTPPLSGPWCAADCFQYPYHDIASRFPRDYYWMYPTMIISVLFILLFANIHQWAAYKKKLYGILGLLFATMSAVILIPNYFIQVSVIPPSLLNGETDGISLISQFNPHGVFIVMEELGFFLMCVAFFSVIPVFSGRGKLLKSIRLTFLISFILAILSFILISLQYGIMREYMFEIAIISIGWFELIIGSVLLSIHFSSEMRKATIV